ncbi:hypothetical protein GSI_13038 [Ganoderma sinense ZZ0214-1]|uniref:F-box domain-containing protein n=1 Tax=Ganoderma sinense ZZ0214-1 TaxID=1077348 RepID=A0A2G8RUH2_9APHY|nr:hypothetical protein GSI_13038 [Ganoderma sinense ZZ0214-1]
MPPHNLCSMQEPSLCFDVLFELFYHVHEQWDAVALASTCKIMNSFGAKRILSFGVEIKDFFTFTSFCLFMLADLDRRGPLLRKLIISIGPEVVPRDAWGLHDIDSDDEEPEMESDKDQDKGQHPGKHDVGVQADSEEDRVESLIVLRALTRLEDLDIGCVEDLLLRDNRDIRRALRNLPALRRLRTAAFGSGMLSLVRGVMAPLVEIDLDLRYHNMDRYIDLFDVLESPAFAATLEKVTVWHVALGGPDFVWHTLKDKPCFPRVHTLSARGIDGGICLPALVHAFPNLHTLDLTDVVHENENGAMNLRAERSRNKAFRLEGVWQSLKHLCGDLDALYALGSTRVVSRVDVDKMSLTAAALRRWRSVVDQTRPSRLLMHFVEETDIDVYATPYLGEFFPSQAVGGMTHLALDFKAAPGNEVWLLMRRLEVSKFCFLRNLPVTSLKSLTVRIGDSLSDLVEWGPLDPSGQRLVWFDEMQLRTLSGWATALFQWFPRLPSVTVDLACQGLGPFGTSITYKKKQYPNRVWRIVSDTWWGPGQGQGVANPSNAAKGMQWHRRPAYSQPPVGYMG